MFYWVVNINFWIGHNNKSSIDLHCRGGGGGGAAAVEGIYKNKEAIRVYLKTAVSQYSYCSTRGGGIEKEGEKRGEVQGDKDMIRTRNFVLKRQ